MVTANVARSEEEAEIQEQTGEAVISTEETETTMANEALTRSDPENESREDLDMETNTAERNGTEKNNDTIDESTSYSES